VSPVNSVSGVWVWVVGGVAVVVVVVPVFVEEPAPIATVAPASASAPAAEAPTAVFLNVSIIGVLSRVVSCSHKDSTRTFEPTEETLGMCCQFAAPSAAIAVVRE
jgi:hypothetical protein